MTFGEVITITLSVIIVSSYPPCVIYAYGRLNYILNYKNEVLERAKWCKNRNMALMIAVCFNMVAAIYLMLNYESYSRHPQLNFTMYKSKKDPLYHQLAVERPASVWEGRNTIENQVKRQWEKL